MYAIIDVCQGNERRNAMEKRFHRDCTKECPHFHTWDLSIDDWTNVCDLLKVQIDDCDMDFNWMYCPLKEGENDESR